MAKIIKWTNKFSNETGYVLTAKKADGHFTNTYDKAEAKTFSRDCDVNRVMNLLATFEDADNNTYEIVEA